MTVATPVVPVTADGSVSIGTVTLRVVGRLHLAVIVKATFAIVPEGRMTPLAPDPIILDEIPDPSGRGLRAAGDLAPHLAQTDVLLTGHAEILPSFSAPKLPVWLAVVRDGAVRIDRRIELDASARVGLERRHVHIHSTGPLSREWPRRSRLRSGVDPRRLQGHALDIPEGFDWSYFQAAPPEQRMEPLRGDEWVVLGGVFIHRPKLRTQLPEARGIARLYRRDEALPRTGVPIQMIADTLHLDADRRCASIVWRGNTSADERALESLHLVAGLELPGQAVSWKDPFPMERSAPRACSQVSVLEELPFAETMGFFDELSLEGAQRPPDSLTGTSVMPDELASKVAATPATPFEKSRQSTAETPDPMAGTFVMPDELASTPAMPFETQREHVHEARDSMAGTFVMPDELASKLAATPATPFELGGGSAETAEEPLAGTFIMSDDLASKLARALATPFERATDASPKAQDLPTVAAAPTPFERPTVRPLQLAVVVEKPRDAQTGLPDPMGGTFVMPDELVSRVAAAPTTPFERYRPLRHPQRQAPAQGVLAPSPMSAETIQPDRVRLPDEPFLEPGGLGAAFLEAMAAAGELA